MKSAHLPLVEDALQLKADDVVVDIGGGTGWFSHRLWKAAGLKAPVVCVDPSAGMLNAAQQQEGVTAVQATAEEFFSQPQEKLFTKALTSGAFHHFTDPRAVLKGVWNSLKPGGKYVILTYLPTNSFYSDVPSFHTVLCKFLTQFSSEVELASLIESSAPFKVQTKVEVVAYRVPKSAFYRSLRERSLSGLCLLSDDEIEDVIAEFERARYSQLRDDDLVTKSDNILIAVAEKQSWLQIPISRTDLPATQVAPSLIFCNDQGFILGTVIVTRNLPFMYTGYLISWGPGVQRASEQTWWIALLVIQSNLSIYQAVTLELSH